MFTPWTKNLYLFCCSIISWKLFRGSLIHGSAPPPRCCSPETMLRKCQSRWLVIVFWLYLCKRRRGCYIRVLHLRVCVCARAAILTRTHVNWTWASTSPPPRSPSPRFGGGLGRWKVVVYLSARYPAHLVYALCLTQQAHKSPSYTRKTISREGSCLLPILFLSNLSFWRWLSTLDSVVVV